MSVLFDTCVFSELRRPDCEPRVRAYFNRLDPDLIYLSAITIGEITKGIRSLAEGRKQQDLELWLLGLERIYSDNILPIDKDVARVWGEVSARARANGVQIPVDDGLIAATALHHGHRLITRNTKHFAATGVVIIDPWAE